MHADAELPPCASASPASPATHHAPFMSEQPYAILVVEDDLAIRQLIKRWLVGHRYAVRMAGDGKEALREIEIERPDLVITDLEMPRMDGMALIAILQRESPMLPIIIMTASASHPGVAGIPLLRKPFPIDHLMTTIQDLLPRA
jgi:two-component system response regulator GlrR